MSGKIRNLFLRISGFFITAFHSIFWGMKGADESIEEGGNQSSYVQEKNNGGVMQQFLQGKETKEVEETRDTYYRVFKEADNYEVSIVGGFKKSSDEESCTGDIIAVAKKKNKTLIAPHSEVSETDGYAVEVIQDKKTYENDIETREKEAILGYEIKNKDVEIFAVERNGYIPRFQIEFYIQKVVVKKNKKGKRILDLYFSKYARQFFKIDSLFITELVKYVEDRKYKGDTLDFQAFEFVTDHSYGAESLHRYKFEIEKLREVYEFDGNYVASFDVSTLIDEDVTEKYRTDELSKKYETLMPKGETTEVGAIIRKEKNK